MKVKKIYTVMVNDRNIVQINKVEKIWGVFFFTGYIVDTVNKYLRIGDEYGFSMYSSPIENIMEGIHYHSSCDIEVLLVDEYKVYNVFERIKRFVFERK